MPPSSSASPAERGSRPAVGVLLDAYPRLSETFVVTELRALAALGHPIHVEATRRGDVPVPEIPGVTVAFREDDPPPGRFAAAILAGGAARDRIDRRRWAREESVPPLRELVAPLERLQAAEVEHLHVHFAAGAALDALRLARILGVPWSLTAHAYDIYKHPENLVEKLTEATFSTSGCDYTVGTLRELLPASRGGDVHRIVMGVERDRFTRGTPYPGTRVVAAVGRLVEKKGFAHLVRAAGLLERSGRPLDAVRIVGEGPLHDELERLARSEGVAHRVQLLGPAPPDGVRSVLEAADALAMPCVVAADGDRDSMPVVVKEALAMEVPVVASAEVGLPEIVRPPSGTLVPPGDPAALAEALHDLLALPADVRAAHGREGRALVAVEADPAREAARLSALIADAASRVSPGGP